MSQPGPSAQQLALAAQAAEAHASSEALVPTTPPPKRPRLSQYETPPLHPAFAKWCESTFAGHTQSSDELTIVLLGQTGSGKTSFLNLLCNFPAVLQHGQEAINSEVKDVRDTSFETDMKAINGEVKDFRDTRFETDMKDRTVSQTGAATVYKLAVGPLRLNIVDTPGFGDTRGRELDRKHTRMIVDRIKGLECVHAITLVVSGRESRMTAQLKFVLSEICAILPKNARNNIVAVFTNTANPFLLSFDIDALSQLVEHTITPDLQIFIENPYVFWERSARNTGKVPGAAAQAALARAFGEANDNLAKFFTAIMKMERLNTDDFERLYRLRQEIEAGTLQALTAHDKAQEEEKLLQQKMCEIKCARSEEAMNKEYTRAFAGKRWVFRDADRHGTFCGVKGCHSNCHAPCKMPKTFENERLRECWAFAYTHRTVTLNSASDRDELLQHMKDVKISFFTDEDGGEGQDLRTVLCAQEPFKFKGQSFIAGAHVAARCTVRGTGFSAARHLEQLRFPARVVISDESDPDTCKRCGHHRKYHHHDTKIWVNEKYTEEAVDEECKQRYFAAKGLRERKEAAVEVIKEKIAQCQRQQQKLSHKLLTNIRQFEQHGLSRNYGMLLQNQRDLLEQHIGATLEGEPGADVSALRYALEEVSKQLAVVQESLRKGSNEAEWAKAMLGLGRGATLEDVEKKHREGARRVHPDKHGGNPERMLQLNTAAEILRKHVQSSWNPRAWWSAAVALRG